MTWTTCTDALQRRAALTDPTARYERMLEIRMFEELVNEDFAEGLIHGTTHLCNGQEALAVALAAELNADDVVAATYRGHGIALALGMTIRSVLGEILGKAEGCAGGLGGSMHLSAPEVGLLPTFAIVGAGLPVAAGAALAFQVRSEPRVAVAVFGDGATNIGAFHEALNLAAIWQLPVVFLCDNNVYGEYTRINLSTPVEDLHVRAASYAMPSEAVDGMDQQAVRQVLRSAIDLARSGGGPTLVEAKKYRFAGHSRADKAEYRPAGEFDRWLERDPLSLTRASLIASGTQSARTLDVLAKEVGEDLRTIRYELFSLPSPPADAMFRNISAAVVDVGS
jgi:acetoin:2,6-dichlorophenolindophenol oxidoreductase subunit alpha